MHKLTRKQILLLASLIFGMFFGAGNLIFPVHLGQLAGKNWSLAGIGFLISATLLPLGALVALSKTRATGLYDFAKPVAKWYGILFLIMNHMALGPMFATPRTAALGYQFSIGSLIPNKYSSIGLFLFSLIFFGLAYYLSVHETGLIKIIGKILNPIFLVIIAILFLVAFIIPMGSLHHAPTLATYLYTPSTSGFLEGYNTMDALAALAFGVTIIRTLRNFKITNENAIAKYTIKSGILAMVLCAIIYLGMILLGTLSLNKFSLSENGGIALSEIIKYYFGNLGLVFMAALTILAVFTTAMGLIPSFAQDFSSQFHFIGYKGWLRLTTLLSFITANFGLNTIINWTMPFLMILYPLAMALIIPALCSNLFDNHRLVYRFTTAFTLIPALFGGIQSLPVHTQVGERLSAFYVSTTPFASIGLGWILPTLCGLILGVIVQKFFKYYFPDSIKI